jgi:hypothetical protein
VRISLPEAINKRVLSADQTAALVVEVRERDDVGDGEDRLMAAGSKRASPLAVATDSMDVEVGRVGRHEDTDRDRVGHVS